MPVYKDFPLQEIIGLRGMVADCVELEDKTGVGGIVGDDKKITIHLKRDMRFTVSYCPDCGCPAPRERRVIKVIRDLPILNHDTYLSCEIFNIKFHIVKKFGDVITKLRAAEYKKADDQTDKDILKGTKWLLLRNKSNLENDAKKELKQLLELNENLAAD